MADGEAPVLSEVDAELLERVAASIGDGVLPPVSRSQVAQVVRAWENARRARNPR